jgi:hypothetical protein
MHKSIFNNKIKNKESSTVGADSKSRKKNERKRQSNNPSTQIQYSTVNIFFSYYYRFYKSLPHFSGIF